MLATMEKDGDHAREQRAREHVGESRAVAAGAGADEQLQRARERGDVIRLRPLRVLVLSHDRRFRVVMSMLLSRRGCSTVSLRSCEDVAGVLVAERIDVLLVDGIDLLTATGADVARSGAAAAPVGVVLVEESDADCEGAPAYAKWGSFERLYAAVLGADRARSRPAPAPGGLGLSVIRASELG
jgi:hypothetical protein